MNQHEIKRELVFRINELWFKHGFVPVKYGNEIINHPLDMRICVSYGAITVTLVDFRGGENLLESSFCVYTQGESKNTLIRIATEKMEAALKEVGAMKDNEN